MEVKNHRMLEKALQMLEYISNQSDGVSLPELCQKLQMPKSSAYNLLMTFVNMGYVKRSNSNRFVIGLKTFEIGSNFLENNDFSLYSRDVLSKLANQVNETAHLAILDGTDVLYLSKCEGSAMPRMSSDIGKRLPAHATALGKVLLSNKTNQELRALYGLGDLKRLTPNTIVKLEPLLKQLDDIRKSGFAYEKEESTFGIQCIAVPVREPSGGICLGLSLSVPIAKTEQELESMKAPLLEAKSQLERVV